MSTTSCSTTLMKHIKGTDELSKNQKGQRPTRPEKTMYHFYRRQGVLRLINNFFQYPYIRTYSIPLCIFQRQLDNETLVQAMQRLRSHG